MLYNICMISQLCNATWYGMSALRDGLQVIMEHPSIAADGHTYEHAAIACWLEEHSTSPVTGQPLLHMHISPNRIIRIILEQLVSPGSQETMSTCV